MKDVPLQDHDEHRSLLFHREKSVDQDGQVGGSQEEAEMS